MRFVKTRHPISLLLFLSLKFDNSSQTAPSLSHIGHPTNLMETQSILFLTKDTLMKLNLS